MKKILNNSRIIQLPIKIDIYIKDLYDNFGINEDKYLCPICLQFKNKKQISEEHVPQKSMGGKKIILTCVNCNNLCGDKIDIHLKTIIDQISFDNKKINSLMTILTKDNNTNCSYKCNIKIDENGQYLKTRHEDEHIKQIFINNIINNCHKNLSKPILPLMDYLKEMKNNISNYCLSNVKISNFELNRKSYNNYKPLVGLLKNAYLILFKFLGYSIFIYDEIYNIKNIINMSMDDKDVSHLFQDKYYFAFTDLNNKRTNYEY